jgi:CRP-like cAMP-binding protein
MPIDHPQQQAATGPARLSTPVLQRNGLLAAMPTDCRMRLLPHLELVQVQAGEELQSARLDVPHVYFPVSAIAALCHDSPLGVSTQVAMVGPDGMLGLSRLAGEESRAMRAVVHSGGAVLALDAERLQRECFRGGGALAVLLRYGHTLMQQMAQTALCNRHHTVEQQLARWLLMAFDRLSGNELETTHEALASLLGVRREGISEAAARLRDAGLIASRRGRITLLDGARLKLRACECYQAPAAPRTPGPRECTTEPALAA